MKVHRSRRCNVKYTSKEGQFSCSVLHSLANVTLDKGLARSRVFWEMTTSQLDLTRIDVLVYALK